MPEWHLTTPETVQRARDILAHERTRIEGLGVPGKLSLTGGSSREGLLTKGDVDLHLRVEPDGFTEAIERLATLYTAALPAIWTPSFAVFDQDYAPPVGIAVTVIGSEHDTRFVRSWEQMDSDPTARERYNLLKQTSADVEAAKSRFFDDLAGRTGSS